ncbi:hypothetical protein [Streptomyces mirabilis]|uniref:Secreted protein n=1 Tax=Streptomyces mirabilis TaxID=68239 RepID=A0A1I2B1N4_9ACTN|nr:hypothetical protein [Streptomyces mirabilis]SFE50085.1 hypothetical protein SAMN02787118_101919 [Streptomyces mirabilis]
MSWAAPAWQRALRRPVALALLHLPADLAAPVSGAPGGHLLPAVGAALCLCSGAARDTAAMWWAASVRTKIRTIPGPAHHHRAPEPPSLQVRRLRCLYHQQTKNLLVSYSPKKLGFF